MELASSLPCSQESPRGPYVEPDESDPQRTYTHTHTHTHTQSFAGFKPMMFR